MHVLSNINFTYQDGLGPIWKSHKWHTWVLYNVKRSFESSLSVQSLCSIHGSILGIPKLFTPTGNRINALFKLYTGLPNVLPMEVIQVHQVYFLTFYLTFTYSFYAIIDSVMHAIPIIFSWL